jgi:type II secretory pathway component PulK
MNHESQTKEHPTAVNHDPASSTHSSQERGLAIILVIFMVALASAILFSLTDSTYVAMRLNSAAEQRIKAEYILKSAVNVAQFLIKNDITAFDDPTQDAWMAFVDGREIPGERLALPEPNIRVSLLIASMNGKVPILQAYSTSGANNDWRGILLRLFQQLDFDNSQLAMNESPQKQTLPNSAQLVANLIDYLDSDKDDFPGDGVIPQGIEENLPDGQTFRNSGTIDSLANELSTIPGFSPGRIQRLLPFVTKIRTIDINVNAASREVLASVLTDPNLAQSIEQCRSQGPIQNPQQELVSRCGVNDTGNSKFRAQGQWFEVIAKVEYGTAMFMASAELNNAGAGAGKLPKLHSFRMY